MKKFFVSIFVLYISLYSAACYAGEADTEEKEPLDPGCLNLVENKEWNAGLFTISELMKMEDYATAITVAKELSDEICSCSPVLNYILGNLYLKNKDRVNAIRSFRKASKYSVEFSISPELAEKIWSARWDVEDHPELIAQFESTLVKPECKPSGLEEKPENYAPMLWTGVGVMAAGVVVTTVGAVLNSMYDQTDGNYRRSLVTIGFGAAMLVTGAVFTGIAGYKYTHVNKENEKTEVNAYVSPFGAGMTMTF